MIQPTSKGKNIDINNESNIINLFSRLHKKNMGCLDDRWVVFFKKVGLLMLGY